MLRAVLLIGVLSMSLAAQAPAESQATEPGSVVLENEYLRAVISPIGARIVSLTDKRGGRELAKNLTKVNSGGLNEVRYGQALNLNEFNDAFELTLETLPDGTQKLTGTARSSPTEEIPGDVVIVKRYLLAKQSSDLKVTVEMHNKGDQEVGLIPWVRNLLLRGHNELPEDAHMTEHGAFNTVLGLQPANRTLKITDGLHYFPASNWTASVLHPGEEGSVAYISVLRPQDMLKVYHWRRKTEDFATQEVIASPLFAPAGKSDQWSYHIVLAAPVRNIVYASPDVVLGVTPHPTWLTADIRELTLSATSTLPLRGVTIKARLVAADQPTATLQEQTLNAGDLDPKAITQLKIPVSLEDRKAYQLRLSFTVGGKAYLPGAEVEDQGDVVIPLIVGKHDTPPRVFSQEAKKVTRLRRYEAQTHRMPQLLGGSAFDAFLFPASLRCFEPDRLESSGSGAVELYASAGEYESSQIVLTPKGKAETTLEVVGSDLAGPGGSIRCESVNRFLYAPTQMPSLYNALFPLANYPEALLPVKSITLQPGKTHPLFVTYHVPRGTKAGVYRGTITLSGGGARHDIPVQMTVWNNELPLRSRNVEFAVSLKGDTVPFARNADGTPWSRAQQLQAIADMHLKYRMTPCDTGLGTLLLKGEFAKVEAEMQKMIDGGATKIYLGAIPQILKTYADKLPEVEAYLQSKGWFDYFYVRPGFDEASPDLAPQIREVCLQWKKVSHIPIMETYYNDERADELFGLLNIWSRNFPLPEWTAARRAAGDRFWKVNAMPGILEYEPWVQGRRRYIMHWDHHITGSYVWCVKYWQGPKKWGEDFWADGGVGNLSACLMWPHETGILSTIRLEAMRDGIEDATLLWSLRERVEALATAKPASPQQAQALENARRFCGQTLTPRINSAQDVDQIRREAGDILSALNTHFPVQPAAPAGG